VGTGPEAPLAAVSSHTVRKRHILHAFATFGEGGPQVRSAVLINSLRSEFWHTIMAMDGNFDAVKRIDPGVKFQILPPPPKRGTGFHAWALGQIVNQVGPELLVTYNWGAIEVLAGAQLRSACPIIHTEDGFGHDEASGLKFRRILARRILLRRIRKTIVPSRTLLQIARDQYGLPEDKVRQIPNGIDTERFRPLPRNRELRSRLGIDDNEVVLGSVGRLRPEKNLGMLIRAFHGASMPNVRLVIVGDGLFLEAWRILARDLGVESRVTFAGPCADPVCFLPAFDIFAMSSLTEQAPVALLEAMGCGLPVVSTDVGDIREMLPPCASRFVTHCDDMHSYRSSLQVLAKDACLRAELGAQNRRWCVTHYKMDAMIAAYRGEYLEAMNSGCQG
jgi:L-malate glycosyltransferase